jgi:hypothetical protein
LPWANLFAADARAVPPESIKFPSPDGKYALFMGWDEERHYDAESEYGWVVDRKRQAGGIVEIASGEIVFAFEMFGRPDEDKALWSADSMMLAYSHRGNKQTELRIFACGDGTVRELQLPELPEVQLDMKPHRGGREGHVHFNHETVEPLRWSGPRALLIAHDLSMTDTTEKSVTYQRKYMATLKFAADGTASIGKLEKQKQKVTVESSD